MPQKRGGKVGGGCGAASGFFPSQLVHPRSVPASKDCVMGSASLRRLVILSQKKSVHPKLLGRFNIVNEKLLETVLSLPPPLTRHCFICLTAQYNTTHQHLQTQTFPLHFCHPTARHPKVSITGITAPAQPNALQSPSPIHRSK